MLTARRTRGGDVAHAGAGGVGGDALEGGGQGLGELRLHRLGRAAARGEPRLHRVQPPHDPLLLRQRREGDFLGEERSFAQPNAIGRTLAGATAQPDEPVGLAHPPEEARETAGSIHIEGRKVIGDHRAVEFLRHEAEGTMTGIDLRDEKLSGANPVLGGGRDLGARHDAAESEALPPQTGRDLAILQLGVDQHPVVMSRQHLPQRHLRPAHAQPGPSATSARSSSSSASTSRSFASALATISEGGR